MLRESSEIIGHMEIHIFYFQTLYLPFINESCIQQSGFANFSLSNLTEDTQGTLRYSDFYNNPNFQKLLLTTASVERIASDDPERITSYIGPCFIRDTTCRSAI